MKEFRMPAFVILFSFICLYVFSRLFGPVPLSINSINTNKSDLFMSTGTGEVSATPTTARVSLGVTQTAATADEAKNAANVIINKVTTDLKTLGIEEKDIKTTNFSVNPDFSVEPRSMTMSLPARPDTTTQTQRFTATANLDVEAKDIDTANKAVDIASAAGANLIGNVSFDVDEAQREELEDQARVQAIEKAKAKAEKIAKAAGIKLGKIVNLSESGGIQPLFMSARSADMKVESEPTQLQPGENTIQVTVTLSYETL